MSRLSYRIATCGLSLAVMAATTAVAAAQATNTQKSAPAPAAKPAAPPPAARPAAPPPAPRVAPPPPAARVAPPPPAARVAPPPPAVRTAPPAPVVRQAPPSAPPAAFRHAPPPSAPSGPPAAVRQQTTPSGTPPAALRQQHAPTGGTPGTPPAAFRRHEGPAGTGSPPSSPAFRQQQQQAPVTGAAPPTGGTAPTFRQQQQQQQQAPVTGAAPPTGGTVPAFRQRQQQQQAPVTGAAPPTGGQPPAATIQQGATPRFGNRQDGDRSGRALSRHPGLAASGAAAATGAAQPGTAAPLSAQQRSQFGSRGANRTLRNQVFTNPNIIGARSRLANATFRGRFAAARFAGQHPNWSARHRHFRNRVIGWYGVTFWPYAYYDFFDYSFWPYAYDEFWPYAYDDLYGSIFGPFAYGYGPGPGYAPPPGGMAEAPPNGEVTGSVQVCADPAATLTNLPIDRIAEAVQPTPEQRQQLDQLAQATGRAVGILKASCPTRLPTTPTARLAAMQSRLQAMLRAVETVAPAINAFYQSLNDEQRARFDSFGQERDTAAAGSEEAPAELAQACDDRSAGIALPIDRIDEEVRPNDSQRAALDNLSNASQRAADMLKANCAGETSLTMVGRVDAMRQRLSLMLNAISIVRPALDAFYNTLDYEQRARFNVIGGQEG